MDMTVLFCLICPLFNDHNIQTRRQRGMPEFLKLQQALAKAKAQVQH